MRKILITQRRIFIAKPMWRTNYPTVIGEIKEVIENILSSEYFSNGIEYIKELDGTKFKRVSKVDIKLA